MREYKILIKIDAEKILEAYIHDDMSMEVITQPTQESFERKNAIMAHLHGDLSLMKFWGFTKFNVDKV
jgi:hypothetical protein